METNVKVVGFANQSINGINVDNRGFDLEYDGRMLNLSGFSGNSDLISSAVALTGKSAAG